MRFSSLNKSRLKHELRPFQPKVVPSSHLRACRTISTTTSPVFRRARDDGSEDDISPEERYQYSRYRWLYDWENSPPSPRCDEAQNYAVRYRRFNLEALLDVASKAAGGRATSCAKVLKCTEDQFNKAFLMTMDNGAEVLAKLPNPNAGPEFYTTASEVATRCFLREVLHFPVPRIHTYSLDPRNPVGSEYIVEKKAHDKPLGSLWDQWPKESQLNLVEQVVDLEAKLAAVSFQQHGCIYYRNDLESRGLAAGGLEIKLSSDDDMMKELGPVVLDKFAMGPLTEARLWEGERSRMTLDRGPWSNPVEYMIAMGTNEIRWTKIIAKPRMNCIQSIETLELLDQYISLLKRYLRVAPFLSPTRSESLHLRTLSHPDLHLDNIFVDPESRKITYIIDWQSASVAELFFQHHVPPMLPRQSSSDRVSTAALRGSESREDASEAEDLLKHYKILTRARNPRRWAALDDRLSSILTKPVSLLCGSWSRDDVFSFRHALMAVIAHWKDLFPGSPICPIDFTDDELEAHASEMELLEVLGAILHQLADENLIPLGGMVLRNNYERAQLINNHFRDIFVGLAENEQQKVLHSRVWPYQDS